METFGIRSTLRHSTLRLESEQPTQFLDMTNEVASLVQSAGIHTGFAHVQSLHTTTAIVVNEHEPLLLADMTLLLDRIAPQRLTYLHDDVTLRTVNCMPGERPNGHSHCRALLLGQSVCLNVAGGRLQLGRWQRLFLVELDGPRSREVSVLLAGDGAR